MHWSERIVLRSCRFIFPKYHKCVISSRETCLRRYCTSFFALFGFTTPLARVLPLHCSAQAVTYRSRSLSVDLRVLTTKHTRVAKIFYRTLLFIFWASVVQSYLSYIVPRHSTYEDTSLGLGLLAGFHFSRFFEQLTCLESRAVPCLYLPISLFFSDAWLLLRTPFTQLPSIEHERLAVSLLRTHSLAGYLIIEDSFGQGPFTRVLTTLIALSFYALISALCPDPVRSMEWRRTSGVLP